MLDNEKIEDALLNDFDTPFVISMMEEEAHCLLHALQESTVSKEELTQRIATFISLSHDFGISFKDDQSQMNTDLVDELVDVREKVRHVAKSVANKELFQLSDDIRCRLEQKFNVQINVIIQIINVT